MIKEEDLLGLYYTRDKHGNTFEIKINCETYSEKWDGKYYLFINKKLIKAYKYKTALTEYVRLNYNTTIMI